MEKEAVDRVGNECITKFQKQVALIDEKLPLPNEEVAAKTKVLQEAMFLRYDAELEECKLEQEKKTKRQELLTTSTRIIADVERNNASATLAKVKKVISYEITKMRTSFEEFCEAKMPLEETKLIEAKFKELKERARALIKGGLSDLPQALTLPDFQLILVEQEEILQEFLTLQTFKNESLLKDQTIDKLHQEAIKKQELLIEQNKKLEKYVAEEKSNTEVMKKQLEDLKKTKEDQDKRNKEVETQLVSQRQELERLRKQRNRCIIL